MENEFIYLKLKDLCKNNEETIEVLIACVKMLYDTQFLNGDNIETYVFDHHDAIHFLDRLDIYKLRLEERKNEVDS